MKPTDKNNNSDNISPDDPPDGSANPPNKDELELKPGARRKKLWKKLLNGFLAFLLVILLVFPSLGLLFNDPVVQSLTGRIVTNIFSNTVGNRASVDVIKIDLRGSITLKGILIKDAHDSTLARIDYLHAVPLFVDWGSVGLVFSRLELDGVEFRLAKYRGEEEFNLNQLINKFRTKDTIPREPKTKKGNFKLSSRKLLLTNATFHLYNENRYSDSVVGMNYNNMKFYDINIAATKFKIINDSLNFIIDSMSTKETCGITISGMSTHLSISSSGLHASQLLMRVDNSLLDLDYGFNYNSYKSYSSFLKSVEMYAKIRPSQVLMSDIGYFTEVLAKMDNMVGLSGEMKGPISNLKGTNLRVHYGDHTRVMADAIIVGLPDFYTSKIIANINEINTTSCELSKLDLPIDQKNIDFTKYFSCNEPISGSVAFEGYYQDFKSDIKLRANEGSIDAKVQYTNVKGDTLHFEIISTGDTIQIGKLLDMEDLLGNLDMKLNIKGNGHSFDDMRVEGSGTFRSVDFNGYNYRLVGFQSVYYNDTVSGFFRIGDKHLMMNVEGFATIVEEPVINADVNILKADLDDLNFWSDQNFSISTDGKVNLRGLQLDDMKADIKLHNSTLTFGNDFYKVKEVIVSKSSTTDGLSNINFKSEFADLDISGKYKITTLPLMIIQLLNNQIDVFPETSLSSEPLNQFADIQVDLKRSDLLQEQFVEDLIISTPTSFHANLKFDKDELRAESNIEKITFKGVEFRNNKLIVMPKNNRLTLNFNTENLIIKDSSELDKTVFGLDGFHLGASVGNDSLYSRVSWNNKNSTLKNNGDIHTYFTKKDFATRLKIEKLDLMINDTSWHVNPENLIVIDSLGTSFNDMVIFGGSSELNINGNYPKTDQDTLQVLFKFWNLSKFDIVTQLIELDFDGIINGHVEFSKANNNPTVTSNLRISNLYANKEYMGDATILNTWDNIDNSIYVESYVDRQGSEGVGRVISVDGRYFPFKDEDAIDLNIAFNRFNLGFVESFVADFVSEIEGVANGNLKLTGTIEKPVLIGEVSNNRAAMKINYLNTKYSFSNKVYFEKDNINFGELVIYDEFNNSANVDGNLHHTFFKKSRFNVSINTDKLLFINTTSKMNDIYYGTAITSGDIKLSGSPNNIKLNINVESQSGTEVSLPLDYSVEMSDKDYIIFLAPEPDTLEFADIESEKNVEKKEDVSKYEIKLNTELNPRAKIRIFLPSDMGRIEAEGKGNLRMNVKSSGDFTIIGDYVVEDGLFHFSLANLVSKRFQLVKGGRISWTGDPYDANVNIQGMYRLRTNLSSLGVEIDTTADFKNKTLVECYVTLKNQLMNPDIVFDIQFPGLDPDMLRMVYSVLDTTNKALMNQQMISLLVLGSFNNSNISNVNAVTATYSVMANQLSSMLSKISDDFDIGVNYRPGDNVSEQEFELALSTQLLDDRLIIEGQFGMTYDGENRTASNMVGDVDVGYKLTEDGRWILKAFNHSNVNSWYNNSFEKLSPYTQGVGIGFRKDFTHFTDLFKRTRPRKNKKEAQETDADEDNL